MHDITFVEFEFESAEYGDETVAETGRAGRRPSSNYSSPYASAHSQEWNARAWPSLHQSSGIIAELLGFEDGSPVVGSNDDDFKTATEASGNRASRSLGDICYE